MKFIIKTAKTLRNHWKKSIAFTCIGIYGARYLNGRYENDLLRRKYCAEAREYGDQITGVTDQNRRITVFLNPASSGGRGRKLFEKNAAPVLYLAGIEVNVVKTEYEGQVKEFFKYLESKHVDGVVVAGGNATLLETITGMMKIEDKAFCRNVPIGVIPIGETNRFATFFYGAEKSEIRRMLDSAMAVVKGDTEKMDVLKIEGDGGKTTYAMCGLEAGPFRDAKNRTSKYWYFGPLKHRWTYLWSTVRYWPSYMDGNIEYSEARETDKPVVKEKKAEAKTEAPEKQKKRNWISKIIGIFVKRKAPVYKGLFEEDQDEVEFENLEVVQKEVSTAELILSSNFNMAVPDQMKGVSVEFGPTDLSKTDFISEGFRRISQPDWKQGDEDNQQMICRKFKFTPNIPENKERWYTIDGEEFEAIPIEVTLIKNKLKFFKCNDALPALST